MSSKVGQADLGGRVNALEEVLRRAEANEEWDAVEPELIQLRAAIYREIAADRAELETSRSEHQKQHGWFARFNPFDSTARDKWKNTVSRKQFELEASQGIEDRVRSLTAKFYADKTRKYAREFIRVTEKIQHGVNGSWDLKAGVAAGASFARASGEEAIARAEEARADLLAAGFVNEAQIAAAVVAGAGSVKTAIQVRDALRGALGEGAEHVAIAAMISGRSAGEAVRIGQQVADDRGGDRTAGAMIAAAIVLSGAQKADQGLARAHALQVGLHNATAKARVAAAALISGKSDAEINAYLKAAAGELRLDPETASMHLAAAILSPHAPEAAIALAREARSEVHGSDEAMATLVSAAVISKQAPVESLAFAKHLQSSLTGTWESEAMVLGAALIAHGMRDRRPRDPELIRIGGAYLIPGLLAPALE